MEFNIPNKLKIGRVDYSIKHVQHCDIDDDFGLWRSQGIIELTKQSGGFEISESKKRQIFFYELTHAILFTMGKDELN